MKREPTLADLFMASNSRPILKNRARFAEKFVFDGEASERVGRVLLEVPELLVEQIQFARPPFDLCWIEYEVDRVYRILNPIGWNPDDMTRDRRVGLLIEHNEILVVSEDFRGRLGIMPITYNLNTEWLLEDQIRFAKQLGMSRLGIDYWMWGAAAMKLIADGKRDYLRILRDTNKATLISNIELDEQMSTVLRNGTMGDFKNHVAILLMLNQPAMTQYVEVPRGRGWIGHKPKPYMAHRTVRVAMDPVTVIRQFSHGEGSGAVRRRHRVRGHYCHSARARVAVCEHQWVAVGAEWTPIVVEVGDDPERWTCNRCQGRRWWREAHARGDAGIGWIDHDYRVEA